MGAERMGKGRLSREDWSSLRLVVAWTACGLTLSGVAIAALLTMPKPPAGGVIVERAIHNMDRDTCERLLRRFADRSGTGSRVLWLWAEESTPGVYTGAPWTTQIAGMPPVEGSVEKTTASPRPASPRPYAFDPAVQAIPPEACTFPNNSLHIVAVEGAAVEGAAVEGSATAGPAERVKTR